LRPLFAHLPDSGDLIRQHDVHNRALAIKNESCFYREKQGIKGSASVVSLRQRFAFTGTPFGFPLESAFTFTGIPSAFSFFWSSLAMRLVYLNAYKPDRVPCEVLLPMKLRRKILLVNK
jgi:hypothetical protein